MLCQLSYWPNFDLGALPPDPHRRRSWGPLLPTPLRRLALCARSNLDLRPCPQTPIAVARGAPCSPLRSGGSLHSLALAAGDVVPQQPTRSLVRTSDHERRTAYFDSLCAVC